MKNGGFKPSFEKERILKNGIHWGKNLRTFEDTVGIFC